MSDAFPSCFRANKGSHVSPTFAVPNLATSLYQTRLGLAAITWSRTILGQSLRIDFRFNVDDTDDKYRSNDSVASFRLHIKPWLFWKKQGSKRFDVELKTRRVVEFSWDLAKARFVCGPEPGSGFYVAVIIDGELILLVGDEGYGPYGRIKAKKALKENAFLVLRREQVFGDKIYTTKAKFGCIMREISIDCGAGQDPRLSLCIDGKRVLQVKRLKWKFRGNERIEVDGVQVRVSWDVYNWLFDDAVDGQAVFMFRFEDNGVNEGEKIYPKGMVFWQPTGLGLNGFEGKKTKKSLLKTSSSSSSSSASSGSSSSVMEWSSVEENELQNSAGFSLIVYAWRS